MLSILALRSRYRSSGGEDVSFESEVEFLRSRGHEVRVIEVDSSEQARQPLLIQGGSLLRGDRDLLARLESETLRSRPDVAYLNNWFPWLVPALATLTQRMPVLVAVRNYRFWCVSGVFFRAGRRCTECFDGTALHGVVHGCYQGRFPSAIAAGLIRKARRALIDDPQVHMAPVSPFVAGFLAEAGVADSRVHVKANMVNPVPDVGPGGSSVLFVGRLEPEKGFETFIEASRMASAAPVVIGDGSLRAQADRVADYRGELDSREVLHMMGDALVTVVPSQWDEPFGRVAAESLGCGTPVIVTNRGGLGSIGDADCAIVVDAGDTRSLHEAIIRVRAERTWSTSARQAARTYFLRHYSPAAVGAALEGALQATMRATGD